mmetsp:Transcript_5143/g.8263  ORF Transcript_5143/g.8263 Transcript_5143/m.8263 type:complete len:91 (+) Transcript_5143:224-496(+)
MKVSVKKLPGLCGGTALAAGSCRESAGRMLMGGGFEGLSARKAQLSVCLPLDASPVPFDVFPFDLDQPPAGYGTIFLAITGRAVGGMLFS